MPASSNQAGDWTGAAEAWQRAAEAARGAARDAPLAAAAEAWLKADDPEQARSALAAMSPEPGAGLAARRALTEARLLLRANRATEALEHLAGLPTGPDDPAAAHILATRAEAAFASRQPGLGVAALVEREALLTDAVQQAANQRRLWNRLQEANSPPASSSKRRREPIQWSRPGWNSGASPRKAKATCSGSAPRCSTGVSAIPPTRRRSNWSGCCWPNTGR
jgi:outer membrane PBP1 activator LpoA protein